MHSTIVQQACAEITGFTVLCQRLEKKIIISGKSMSTLHNYMRCIAHITLHFRLLPTQLTEEQVEDYLYNLKKRNSGESTFKHTIYGLRFLYRAEGLPQLAVKLPSMKRNLSLPVVLSRAEMRELLTTPVQMKQHVMIAILYGCGLRCQEVRNLQIRDIDLDRNLIHIRQSKGKKDRYVPIGLYLSDVLKNYLLLVRPVKWFFNGKNFNHYSPQGVQHVVREVHKKTSIKKRVTPHTLRHTYATHLLEQGLDIVTIKELLGHARIETTMTYLHVILKNNKAVFSPLDTVFDEDKTTDFEGPKVGLAERNHVAYVLQKRAENRLRSALQDSRQIELSF